MCFVVITLLFASLFGWIFHFHSAPESTDSGGGVPNMVKIRSGLPILLFLALSYCAYFLPFIAAPRMRDIGFTPWLCIVYLIQPIAPFVALLALFAPTDWYRNWKKRVGKE
jgi:uncharacterized membrane protein YhaH (DUF805 family)